jgi:hypothetical protein
VITTGKNGAVKVGGDNHLNQGKGLAELRFAFLSWNFHKSDRPLEKQATSHLQKCCILELQIVDGKDIISILKMRNQGHSALSYTAHLFARDSL